MLALPVAAAGTNTANPVLDNQVNSRIAHLTWKSAVRETEMGASIAYISSLNGTSTSTLSSLLSEFQQKESQIGSLTTHIGVNNLIRDIEQVNAPFRQELRTQMKAGRGRPAELRSQVDAAVQGDGRLATLESSYWTTRSSDELANFDLHVQRSQGVIDTLKAKGYDTTAAQAKLGEITAKRSALESALALHDKTQIPVVQQQVVSLWQQLAVIVKDLQVQVPQNTKIQFHINEGNRAVARADMVNADLKSLAIDTTQAEQYTAAARSDLAAAQASLTGGNPDTAKSSLEAAKQDLRNLSLAYRDIAKRYQVPAEAASEAPATAAALDSMVTSMETA
jgi:hypothetical protein